MNWIQQEDQHVAQLSNKLEFSGLATDFETSHPRNCPMPGLRRYNLWVYIFRSEEDPQTWISHCLELDIVAFGDSPVAARDAIRASLEDAILEDLKEGLDPLERNPAPRETHDAILRLQQVGRCVQFSGADVAEREQVTEFAVILALQFALGVSEVHIEDAGFKAFGLSDAA